MDRFEWGGWIKQLRELVETVFDLGLSEVGELLVSLHVLLRDDALARPHARLQLLYLSPFMLLSPL